MLLKKQTNKQKNIYLEDTFNTKAEVIVAEVLINMNLSFPFIIKRQRSFKKIYIYGGSRREDPGTQQKSRD